ncbi:Transcriptional regulator, xre family [Halapricum desulfuricans]|uniref:Transcriptional regulator, xre family n=1 Tax=Halapricum desulfuricans TaxID=2841257 RepID=A0A897NLX6_9EURY|nr:helix-turn-helix transcriptional regulator [Halapricum desulfuricans]QSG12465.1 Transcriptional regulator, xre family [Halapricum desulfuricans]
MTLRAIITNAPTKRYGDALAVSVARQTINAIKRDRYDPSLELAFALAEHVDCAIEDIFDPADIDP